MQSSRSRNFLRKDWSVFNGTGFQYDASVEYHNHPLIVIGSMNKKCQYCDAFKWNDETAGECAVPVVYFMGDEQNEVNRRCRYIEGVERETVLKIQQMLHSHNVLLKIFKSAIDNWPSDNYKVVIHADRTPRGEHERRYNAPMVNEVAVLVTAEPCSPRGIVLRAHDNTLQLIANTHKFYDALQYPLIFSKGEPGYYFNIPVVNPTTEQPIPSKKVSYAISADDNIRPNDIGKIVILPSTFANSPRYLQEYTQDAFTYVRTYGRPDLFVTFTCNPSWQDVTQELMSGQKATE
ncbi:helitron_like_N domain-containing protein [Trichonephila clavipes]|nr:helitron_like_N domain-containing protein [Trichonephila clavipes]